MKVWRFGSGSEIEFEAEFEFASKVILGTAASPNILEKLPPERVIAALDAVDGEVVVEGWVTRTGVSIADRMRSLAGLVGGFLVTFVEREGRMGGPTFRGWKSWCRWRERPASRLPVG